MMLSNQASLFRKILIANRGEIALRIIRTCRKLKVKTVAVYSDPDLASRHVLEADEAHRIGPGEPADSYLNIGRIVAVAKKTGVEGVHPGYGFLAENPDFAVACEEAGLSFIGPSSKVLRKVANKLESKAVVSRTGVPAIPGPTKEITSSEEADQEARRIGYPVIVKAVHGGGGRGMRIVKGPKALKSTLERARAEAKTSFGRDELYLEKYLEKPRHIEVQILAGRRGRVVHLGERECSLQRRYQKILEETPSPALNDKERKRLVSLALRVAGATKYENAGTIEFVRSQDGRFYYMETNKRIQVEHLITEMVTGVDIVEEQLRIASGEGLSFSQQEIRPHGAAINCRINAEDPARAFAPTPGRVTRFVPPGGPGIRVDTALYEGCPVPEYYDSLIAKIASQGRSRFEAIERMKIGLGETVLEGVRTTIPLHRTLMDSPMFVKGAYHTQVLDKFLAGWSPQRKLTTVEVAAVFVGLKKAMESGRASPSATLPARSGWRTGLSQQTGPKPALYVEGA